MITLFVDGDRGGDLIIKEAMGVAEIDFVIKAPDGKEVEEITKKEIHKALRSKVAAEQAKMEIKDVPKRSEVIRKTLPPRTAPAQQSAFGPRKVMTQRTMPASSSAMSPRTASAAPSAPRPAERKSALGSEQQEKFKQLLEDLIGTRGAYILDDKLNILGKVPTSELESTMKSLSTGIFAVVFDGSITREIVDVAERTKTQFVVAMDSKVKPTETRVMLLTSMNF